MAVFIGPTGIGLTRTTGTFLNPAGAFTFMYWVMNAEPVIAIVGADYQTFTLLGTPDYSGAYVFTGSDHAGGGSFDFRLKNQNAALTAAASTYADIQEPTIWYHVAVTYNGVATWNFYLNGWLVDTVTNDLTASSFSAERIGIETDPTHGGFAICAYRSWASALTQAEIRIEMAFENAQKATPFCDTPLPSASDLADDSGNARNWSATGVVTTVTGPTFRGATNTNTSAAAAYELAPLPVTNCQQCGTGAATIDVWYKLTWSDADSYVSVFGQGSNSGYVPLLKAYDGLVNALAGTLYLSLNNVASKPATIPVYQGHVYYFLADQTGNTANPVLIMSALDGPHEDFPSGSLAINDDTDGFPLAIMSSSTSGADIDGTAIAYILDFPAGEDAHILPISGNLLVQGEGPIGGAGWFGYDQDLARVAGPIDLGLSLLSEFQTRCSSDRDTIFYVMGSNAGNTAFVGTTIDSATWTASATQFHPAYKVPASPPSLYAIAPSLDRTILYYATSDEYIQRWDLVNDIALSDLASPVANYTLQGIGASGTGDLLVMPDDTIVATYQRSSTTATKVIIYNPDGSLVATYDYASLLYNHTAHDGPNETTFWMWAYAGNSGSGLQHRLSTFLKIDLTDGSILQQTSNMPQFSHGGYLTANTQALPAGGARPDPLRRFGHSPSCPFWITRSGAAPEPETFSIIEHPIRRLRRAPHLNNENKRIFYPGFELDFQRGIGTPGQSPGENPVLMFRISRDGGRTWSSYMNMHAGELGQYKARATLKRLGYARDAVFEVTTSDPNNFVLTNAWLTPDPTSGEH